MQKPTHDFSMIETFMHTGVMTQAILQSIRAGIFDTLSQERLTASQLAGKHGFAPSPTEALLDLLVAHELLEKHEDHYGNSGLATEFLVSSSPFCQDKAMELNNSFNEYIAKDFIPLLKGETRSRDATDDKWCSPDVMEGTAQHSRRGAIQDTVDFTAALPNFQELRRMCDIGGNHGEFSMNLLDRNPGLSGVIVDLPHVVERTLEHIDAKGYSQRLSAQGQNLRESGLPAETWDLVLASHVLYAFLDTLEEFLAMIHRSLTPGGWFVTHHLNPASQMSASYTTCVEFLTRMAGYSSHFIARERLEQALTKSGFVNLRFAFSGPRQAGLIAAGQKS